MVSSELRNSFAQGYLFLANMINMAKIEKLIVPEVVQSGSADVVLDCQFAVLGDHFTLQWWFTSASANRSSLVYEWSPRSLPKVAGMLEGRLDMNYKVTLSPIEEHRAIRLLRIDPQLDGEYACVIISDGVQVRQAKRMVVFSPEKELDLTIIRKINLKVVEITCHAFGVYPQPDLILEYDKRPIVQQVQRVQRGNSSADYDAESKANLVTRAVAECGKHLEVTCRLYLPQADYTAIKKKFFDFDGQCNEGRKDTPMKILTILLISVSPNALIIK